MTAPPTAVGGDRGGAGGRHRAANPGSEQTPAPSKARPQPASQAGLRGSPTARRYLPVPRRFPCRAVPSGHASLIGSPFFPFSPLSPPTPAIPEVSGLSPARSAPGEAGTGARSATSPEQPLQREASRRRGGGKEKEEKAPPTKRPQHPSRLPARPQPHLGPPLPPAGVNPPPPPPPPLRPLRLCCIIFIPVCFPAGSAEPQPSVKYVFKTLRSEAWKCVPQRLRG